jgi:hypothetical protein
MTDNLLPYQTVRINRASFLSMKHMGCESCVEEKESGDENGMESNDLNENNYFSLERLSSFVYLLKNGNNDALGYAFLIFGAWFVLRLLHTFMSHND